MGRVEDYLGDRLRGLEIPADLRRLVELELDGALSGEDSVQPFAEVHVLVPGELHALQDPDLYIHDDEGTQANGRAIDEVLEHMAVVVDGFNGDLFGYWLHPDEPPTDQPVVVTLNTEGEFDTLDGATLVEAMVFDWLGYDEDTEYLARIVAFCERHELPLGARNRDELRKAETATDPALLHDIKYRRFMPFTPRPAWADTDDNPALIGRLVTDPAIRAQLERYGIDDPEARIRAIDEGDAGGLGEARLSAAHAPVTFTFYLDADRGWWLFQVRYGRPDTSQAAGGPALPYGLSFADNRDATRERLGPNYQAAILAIDRWELGPISVLVRFDADGLPTRMELWPQAIHRRS